MLPRRLPCLRSSGFAEMQFFESVLSMLPLLAGGGPMHIRTTDVGLQLINGFNLVCSPLQSAEKLGIGIFPIWGKRCLGAFVLDANSVKSVSYGMESGQHKYRKC